jgi:hypothetical protein
LSIASCARIGSKPPDDLFKRMATEFGHAKFIECVGLLGHYITIGTVIRMFDVQPPVGTKTF